MQIKNNVIWNVLLSHIQKPYFYIKSISYQQVSQSFAESRCDLQIIVTLYDLIIYFHKLSFHSFK